MNSRTARRTFLGTSTIAATGLLLVGCNKKSDPKSEIEVTAAEDLMREHGVLPTTFVAQPRVQKSDLPTAFH